ncbi:MAG: FG-GAP-like repeat-containing protein [Acidobacteriia bacterium]|nr:FG-GAP-like repeat-containing protein [Terriglobia bacterium]
MIKRYSACVVLFLGCSALLAQEAAFQPAVAYPVQKGPIVIATADFNHDGKPDIAVANATTPSISVLLGNGDGTFKAPLNHPLTLQCQINYLAVADFNKDGNPDLLGICVFGTDLLVLPGKGDGTFGDPVSTPLSQEALAGNFIAINLGLAVADFDSDGKLDIAIVLGNITSNATNAHLLRGHGDGTFAAPEPIGFGGAGVISLATGDFNGDGHADLAALVEVDTGQSFDTTVVITLGAGDGSFHTGASYTPLFGGGSSIAVGDVNGDGIADLVVYGMSLTRATSNTSVAVYTGKGNGTFKAVSYISDPAGSLAMGLSLAELGGTGKVDIVEGLEFGSSSTPPGAIIHRAGNGDGTFQDPVVISLRQDDVPLSILVGDFNGDGRPDIAAAAMSSAALVATGTVIQSGFNSTTTILAGLPAGVVDVLLNSTTTSLTFTNTNAASFQPGPLAADSIVSAFGTGLASGTATAKTLPLPKNLGGDTVNVKDSAGTTRQAPLFYVSSTQINYGIPEGTALGAATITIEGNADTFSTVQQIVSTAPGLFGTNGLAAGNVLTVNNGVQTAATTFQVDASGNVVPTPIDVGSGSTQVFLLLYGTGIRHHSGTATATLGTTQVTATYAGEQGVYIDEDQINIPLPQSLKGAGLIHVTLTVDGELTNAVDVLIK